MKVVELFNGFKRFFLDMYLCVYVCIYICIYLNIKIKFELSLNFYIILGVYEYIMIFNLLFMSFVIISVFLNDIFYKDDGINLFLKCVLKLFGIFRDF